MKNSIPLRALLISLGLTLMLPITGSAQVPTMMSYQGRLTAGGTNFNGTGWFKFALVNKAGNDSLWSNDGTSVSGGQPSASVAVTVSGGLFSVMLGDTSIPNMREIEPDILDYNNNAHLRIWFSADGTTFTRLTPDQPVGSTLYAMLAAKVPPGSIGSGQLANNAVTGAKIADSTVTGAKISDATVTGAKIANLAVTGAKIADSAVTGAKIANLAVTGAKIVNGTITSNKIDWSTMPAPPTLRGYAENGTFATAPMASGDNAIALGAGAVASGSYATVGGGYSNRATRSYATVGGGDINVAAGYYSTVAGGYKNQATNYCSTIGGGYKNEATATNSTVAGGSGNIAAGANSAVGGGIRNSATGDCSVVAGGSSNTAGGHYAMISGGSENTAIGEYSSVSGGVSNRATGTYTTISGGARNHADGQYATVGGGELNSASGGYATVSGGKTNRASGSYSTVAGGYSNSAGGVYAMIPGGSHCTASGTHSFAAGRQAKAIHDGSFVWADTFGGDFASAANNQFRIRATGGFQLVSGGHWDLGTTQGDMRIGNDSYNLRIGVAQAGGGAGASWLRAAGGVEQLHLWAAGGLWVYSNTNKTSGVRVASGGGSWITLSDRNAKEAFEPVDPSEVLEKVASLPITTWKYKAQDAAIRHIGPMAQDFYAAFGVGETDTGIATIDADGVALAAIQGLNQKNQKLEEEVGRLEEEVARIQKENANLRKRLEQIEALIAGTE